MMERNGKTKSNQLKKKKKNLNDSRIDSSDVSHKRERKSLIRDLTFLDPNIKKSKLQKICERADESARQKGCAEKG